MGMFRLYLSIVLFAGIQLTANGQCTGNALWLNEENDGNMKDTALIGGGCYGVRINFRNHGQRQAIVPYYKLCLERSSIWRPPGMASL